jgi:hypothetical protein
MLVYSVAGDVMSKIESIEHQIQKLSPEESAAFRRWYAAFDAEVWDRQFEADVKAGKLDELGDKALRAHNAGQSTKL